jgi:hypothetical protein
LKQVRAEAETAAGTKFGTRNDAGAGAGVEAEARRIRSKSRCLNRRRIRNMRQEQ